ncbi:MAG: indole-3-glycerol phosphate synthase TrpC [Deltaproteobacteria bacterium]|nr:indole-3-glycerol phosphate synthase TrpC [Deltaproteobacteria bacterium]
MKALSDILAATRRRVARDRSSCDWAELDRRATAHHPRGFHQALAHTSSPGIAIIAELKPASPSRGVIRADFDCIRLAKELETAGARALSVLTDREFFQGSLENLRTASSVTRLPCLRKDFILDEFQILEARANSADAVLLIVAALSRDQLATLLARAQQFQLDVLCEVHDQAELGYALDAGCTLIGVNSRDLRSFKTDLGVALRLAPYIPAHVLAVAESGIESGSDIARLREVGYRAFLVGETLMRAQDPGQAMGTLLAEAGAGAKVGLP